MMKIKKALCIFFSLVLCLSIIPMSVFADETEYKHEWEHTCKTDCNGECGYTPVIVVPGIMQSQTYVQDADGNDLMTSDGFPIVEGMDMSFMFDTVVLEDKIKSSVPEMLGAIAKRDRDQLFDILLGIFDESFSAHYFNDDGTRVNGVAVDEYWYSLEECMNQPEKSYNYMKGYSKDENGNTLPTTKYKNEYDFIKRQVDLSEYCEMAGYDHAYYYSYASFGNMFDVAEGLNEYIDMVKMQTGHNKVDIVFISLGGTIANTFLAKYADYSELDRVILAAAALDGSYLLGDLMGGKTTLGDGEVIYNDLIPNIVNLAAEEYMALAYLGNVVARAIPQEVFSDFLNEALQRAIDEVLGKMLRNCQSMWALVPSAMYPELSQAYISDESHAKLKAQTDEYYQIQLNAADTLKSVQASGVDVFVICGYNLALPAAVEHWKQSSDEIIQVSSTSLGATAAPVGEVLGKDYKPAIDSSYISPDGVIDAGTCALPDHTFFVRNQSHLDLQSSINDVIGLCVDLLTDSSIKDARVNNGGYPQFNEYRDLRQIDSLLYRYVENKYEGKNADVDAAVDKAVKLKQSKIWSQAEAKAVEEELYTAMSKAGMLSDSADSPFVKYKLIPAITAFLKKISDLFSKIFGGNDFWLVFIPII